MANKAKFERGQRLWHKVDKQLGTCLSTYMPTPIVVLDNGVYKYEDPDDSYLDASSDEVPVPQPRYIWSYWDCEGAMAYCDGSTDLIFLCRKPEEEGFYGDFDQVIALFTLSHDGNTISRLPDEATSAIRGAALKRRKEWESKQSSK